MKLEVITRGRRDSNNYTDHLGVNVNTKSKQIQIPGPGIYSSISYFFDNQVQPLNHQISSYAQCGTIMFQINNENKRLATLITNQQLWVYDYQLFQPQGTKSFYNPFILSPLLIYLHLDFMFSNIADVERFGQQPATKTNKELSYKPIITNTGKVSVQGGIVLPLF